MLQYSSKISAVVKKNVILKLFELINFIKSVFNFPSKKSAHSVIIFFP